MKKRIIWIVIGITITVITREVVKQSRRAEIMTGFAAKLLCSCVFTSDIQEQSAVKHELGFSPISSASATVNYENKSVESTVYGLAKRTAAFIQGKGCILTTDQEANHEPYQFKLSTPDSLADWYDYHSDKSHLSPLKINQLQRLVNEAFEENLGEDKVKKTRGVVIVHKGQLVTEKYDKGITKDTRLLGWSMTKSLAATVLGAMIEEGRLTLDDHPQIPGWQNDERRNITFRHLLNMNSGIAWEEDYSKISSVTNMLFNKHNMGAYAAKFPSAEAPNKTWYYSSGTTNLLSYALSQLFENQKAYVDYIYHLFNYELGMSSLMIETDMAGYPVMSSYGWATARDWAKFGQLYLNGGSFNAKHMLSASWIDFIKTPVEGSDGEYGGHFWLNTEGKRYPSLPKDVFYCDGFQGQRVYIIPSHELVIVRLGSMYKVDDAYLDKWVKRIVDAVE